MSNKALTLAAIEGEILPDELCYQSMLRQAVFDGITEKDVKEIVQGMVKRAKEGDAKAQTMLFTHVLGATKPANITVNNHFENAEQAERLTRGGRRSREAS